MTHEFIDCQGLAGGYSLGAVKAGFEMVYRVSFNGGFGDDTADANRALLGDRWVQDPGGDWEAWEPQQAAFLAGTPPCSGFSNLTTRGQRGPGADVNKCMWNLVNFAGRCFGSDGKPGPEVVSLESVQGAFTLGRPLMHALWTRLEGDTGQTYELHHVLMSGASVGAAQRRHRYFLILSRIPFGIDEPVKADLPDGQIVTYKRALSDLEDLKIQWETQTYKRESDNAYQTGLRTDNGRFDCHATAGGGLVLAVAKACELGWKTGTFLSEGFDELDLHPDAYTKVRDMGVSQHRRGKSSYRGLNWPLRIDPDDVGRVLAGSCVRDYAHYTEPRLLTVRELSRLMGYPDSWRWPHKITRASLEIGKCAPVPSCEWISGWVKRALDREPGSNGRPIGEDEYLHQSTHLYRDWQKADAEQDVGLNEGTKKAP